jgi:cytochrome c
MGRNLHRLISLVGAIGLSSLLLSCGGGGGGGTVVDVGSSPTSTAALTASVYTGYFVGTCYPLAKSSNYENGAALYVKTVLSVGPGNAASAPLISRFDFFDSATCTGQALGTLHNNNENNALTLVSATSVNGRSAHKLILSFGNASANYQDGPTADTVIYGTALRLKLPRVLFTGFTAYDLWSLDNNDLYEGNYNYGADGFPTGLLATPVDTKVATLPAVPEATCAAQTLNWTASGNSCVGLTTPSASRLSQQLVSTPSTGTVGGASFTCSNGAWSVPANATCRLDLPVFTTCPVQTITWTSGSNTCSGETPVTIAGNDVSVVNTVAGNSGGRRMSCQADGSWVAWAGGAASICYLTPPPITDPLQLAQAKNCLTCHSVTNPGYTSGPTGYTFPSFQSISNYYRASPPPAGVLENKIKAGGVGVFGTVAMPANPQVSDADLAILIPWILAQ